MGRKKKREKKKLLLLCLLAGILELVTVISSQIFQKRMGKECVHTYVGREEFLILLAGVRELINYLP